MTLSPRFVACGDRSVLVYLGDRIDPEINDAVLALTQTLSANPHPALVDVTPSYHCVLIVYDPLRIRLEQLEEMVLEALKARREPSAPRVVELPVCYGKEMGPDRKTVAEQCDLAAEAAFERHADDAYRVYALGCSPGFPYLGGLDPLLEIPRLIGRTSVRLFDPRRNPPTMLEPGDLVRFVPVSEAEFTEPEPFAPHTLPDGGDGRTGLRIIQPGMSTTIQDLGRRGYMRYGVPVGGAADWWSLMVGNWLLGNRARTEALEITLTGPEIEFTGPIAFALTGAPAPAELIPAAGSSPRQVPYYTAMLAAPGDRLRIGAAPVGCRSYLCIAGGLDIPPVLGSLSEDLFGRIGPLGRPLQAGDFLPTDLPIRPPADLAGRALPQDGIPVYGSTGTLRVVRGPQASAFRPDAFAALFGQPYVVGQNSDRQGLRLEGAKLAHVGSAEILSEPVAAGAIQVPGNGQPILLLGNRQTTGGFTQIGVTIWSDLPVAGQLRTGDQLRFQEVDASEVSAIVRAERRRLAQIRRYLEREERRRPDQMAREIAERIALQSAQQADVAAPAQPVRDSAPQAAVRSRVLRVTIGAIEYQALVEDLPD